MKCALLVPGRTSLIVSDDLYLHLLTELTHKKYVPYYIRVIRPNAAVPPRDGDYNSWKMVDIISWFMIKDGVCQYSLSIMQFSFTVSTPKPAYEIPCDCASYFIPGIYFWLLRTVVVLLYFCSAGRVAPVARDSAGETAWHRRNQQ